MADSGQWHADVVETVDASENEAVIVALREFESSLIAANEIRDRALLADTSTRLESFAQALGQGETITSSKASLGQMIEWTARGLREKASDSDQDWDGVGAALAFLESFIEQLEDVFNGNDIPTPSREAREWFRHRGLWVYLERRDDGFWASLYRISAGDELVAPDYGRGATPDSAVERARQRYEQEQ